jgi:hypothetical protein
MSNALAGTIRAIMSVNFDNALDLTTVRDALSQTFSNTFTDGTGANKAQVMWHDQRTLATTTGEDLDLAGSLSCAFGTVTFTKVKVLLVYVTTTTAGYTLQVGGAAANQMINWVVDATDKIVVGAGGMLLLTSPVDGYAVTAATGDLLKVYNPSGGSVVYDIVVIGEGSVA